MNKKFVGLAGLLASTIALASINYSGAQYFPPSGGGGTGPTTNPVTPAQGGTGLSSPGASGNALVSNGTNWTSSPVVNQLLPGTGITLSPSGGTGVVTINATGGGGSGTVDSGAQNAVPYYNQTGTNARVGPNPAATLTSNGTMHLGGNGVGAGALLLDSNNGSYQNIQTQTLSGNVNFFMPTTQSVQDQVYMGGSSGGYHTWNTVAGGVGVSSGVWRVNPGDGSDGAVTAPTNPLVNASSINISTTLTSPAVQHWHLNSTGVATFSSGTLIDMTTKGGAGGSFNTATFPATDGSGPNPGFASLGVYTNGGSGGGGASGAPGGAGGGLTGAVLLAPASGTTSAGVVIGSGGGGLGGTGTTTFSGSLVPGTGVGYGGGIFSCSAAGAITVSSGAFILASAPNNSTSSTTNSGFGGGGGGCVELLSRTSINVAAGTISAKGGAGGAGGSTSGGGGGGGGGGFIVLMSPSTTNSLVTATAVAGGAAGTTVSGTNATAGSVGTVLSITGTPNLPLISLMHKDGYAKIIDHCHQTEVADLHGYSLNQVQASRWVSHNMQEYIACMETYDCPETRILRARPVETADEQRRIA